MSNTIAIPSSGSRIVRGTISAFALNVLSYGFLFIGQMLIARLLPRSEYAIFTVSISFVAVLSLIADLGMNPLFAKLFAEAEEDIIQHNEDRRGTLLGSALTLRFGLTVLVAVVFFVVAPLMYPEKESIMAILLLSLVVSSRMLIVRSVGESILRARGRYYVVAWFGLFDAVAFAILMTMATYRRLGLSDVMWIYTLSNIPGFLLLVLSLLKWIRTERIRLRVTSTMIRSLLNSSLPLAIGTAFLTIHTQIDNLLLDKLSSPAEVANYGATMRLSAAMAPFSLVLAAVTSPELTRLLRRNDTVRSRHLTSISLRLLLIAGTAIALLVTALSHEIVPFFLGEKYLPASSLLIWTGWMLVPIFIGTLLMDVSIAAGNPWHMTTNAGICMVTVIIGDLILIPKGGATGAMTSKLIAVTLAAGAVLWLSRNTNYIDSRQFVIVFFKTTICAIIALGVLSAAPAAFSPFLIAFLGIAVFGMGIHFLKVITFSEAAALLQRVRPREGVVA